MIGQYTQVSIKLFDDWSIDICIHLYHYLIIGECTRYSIILLFDDWSIYPSIYETVLQWVTL